VSDVTAVCLPAARHRSDEIFFSCFFFHLFVSSSSLHSLASSLRSLARQVSRDGVPAAERPRSEWGRDCFAFLGADHGERGPGGCCVEQRQRTGHRKVQMLDKNLEQMVTKMKRCFATPNLRLPAKRHA
jgi:hypothetical protein